MNKELNKDLLDLNLTDFYRPLLGGLFTIKNAISFSEPWLAEDKDIWPQAV